MRADAIRCKPCKKEYRRLSARRSHQKKAARLKVEKEAELEKNPRRCLGCETNINHRHPRSIRCERCQKDADTVRARKASARQSMKEKLLREEKVTLRPAQVSDGPGCNARGCAFPRLENGWCYQHQWRARIVIDAKPGDLVRLAGFGGRDRIRVLDSPGPKKYGGVCWHLVRTREPGPPKDADEILRNLGAYRRVELGGLDPDDPP